MSDCPHHGECSGSYDRNLTVGLCSWIAIFGPVLFYKFSVKDRFCSDWMLFAGKTLGAYRNVPERHL